jgi:hypothetical protein
MPEWLARIATAFGLGPARTVCRADLTADRPGHDGTFRDLSDRIAAFAATRQSRFLFLSALADGTLYEDKIHLWASGLKEEFALSPSPKPLYNPFGRLREFWGTHLYSGTLDPSGGDGKARPSSVPIEADNRGPPTPHRPRPPHVGMGPPIQYTYGLTGAGLGEVGLFSVNDLANDRAYVEARRTREDHHLRGRRTRQGHVLPLRGVAGRPPGRLRGGRGRQPLRPRPRDLPRGGRGPVPPGPPGPLRVPHLPRGRHAGRRVRLAGQPGVLAVGRAVPVPAPDARAARPAPPGMPLRRVRGDGDRRQDPRNRRRRHPGRRGHPQVRRPRLAVLRRPQRPADRGVPGPRPAPGPLLLRPRAKAQALLAAINFADMAGMLDRFKAEILDDKPELQKPIKNATGDASGALRIYRQALETKGQSRRANYDAALAEQVTNCLRINGIMGRPGFEDFTPRRSPPAPSPSTGGSANAASSRRTPSSVLDERKFWANAESADRAGVPIRVYLRREGLVRRRDRRGDGRTGRRHRPRPLRRTLQAGRPPNGRRGPRDPVPRRLRPVSPDGVIR